MISFLTGNPLYLILVIVIVVIGLLYAVPKFRNNKSVKSVLDTAEQVAPLVAPLIPSQFSTVFGIAENVVRYTEQIMSEDAPDAKKQTAYDTVTELLSMLKVDVDDNTKKLINIAIESAVNKMKAQ